MIRIQKHCTPEVADALDRLQKEMKKPTIKRPLSGGEARHDEIETAIIQALAPLQNTQDFEEIISKTNDYKQTLAHFAVQFGYANLLRRLVGWNIDLSIADVNGFTALHCAYKKGDRACVDLLLEKGASETVLDTLGRAPSHLMPEGFASLNDPDSDTVSDDQLEMEQERDAPDLFQSPDSWHEVSNSCDEKLMSKARLEDLMDQSRSSHATSNSQSTLRSPPLPVAPAHPPLSPTPLARHRTMAGPPSPRIRLPRPPSPFRAHAGSLSSQRRGKEPSMTSALRSAATSSLSGAIRTRAMRRRFSVCLHFSDPRINLGMTTDCHYFYQTPPSDAGGQIPFQTAFYPSFITGPQPSLTTKGGPLNMSRSHASLATEFIQQAIPRTQFIDFGRQGKKTRQAGLKPRWSHLLNSTQENHLELLWNAHRIEGSYHLAMESDVSHDPHGPVPTFAGNTDTSGISPDIWGGTTSSLSMLSFGQPGAFGDVSGLAGLGGPQIGITVGHNGSSEDGIEIDYPLGSGDPVMITAGASLTRPTNKQEDLSIGVDGPHSRRSSSIEAGSTN